MKIWKIVAIAGCAFALSGCANFENFVDTGSLSNKDAVKEAQGGTLPQVSLDKNGNLEVPGTSHPVHLFWFLGGR